MFSADGAYLVISRGKVLEKGKAVFRGDDGKEDVSFRMILIFMGGKRTIYFDSEVEMNTCPVKVGQRFDAIGEASEGKGGKVYMRNVVWLQAGKLSDAIETTVNGGAAAGADPSIPPGLPPRNRAAA